MATGGAAGGAGRSAYAPPGGIGTTESPQARADDTSAFPTNLGANMSRSQRRVAVSEKSRADRAAFKAASKAMLKQAEEIEARERKAREAGAKALRDSHPGEWDGVSVQRHRSRALQVPRRAAN